MIDILISASSGLALYKQVAEQLRESIIDGRTAAGEALPSIRALAAKLSISVITTKRAYDELEAEGLIETIPGRGCFAAGSSSILRERRLKLLEQSLSGVLKQAEYLNLDIADLTEMLCVLKEEDCGSGN